MRQRITYLLPHGTGADPADIHVDAAEVRYARAGQAAEERRITLAVGELPGELPLFLDSFHELHIRIATSQQRDAFVPAVSRMPPGLHVFFTPRKPHADTRLCAALNAILRGRFTCSDSPRPFTRPPILSERFATASTYQFYQDPRLLREFHTSLRARLCATLPEATSLGALCNDVSQASTPTHVDIDFDVISHTLNVVLFWTPAAIPGQSSQPSARKLDAGDRVEVGILSPEEPDEPEELSLGGYLTVLGEDEKPNPTLFSFPARHHPLPSSDKTTYSVRFNNPTGLHPILNISFLTAAPTPPKSSSCALHAYFTLPSYLFIDRYQLSDTLFLSSQNLVSLRAISGEQDLEAPDWAVRQWGSAALFELGSSGASVTIPTHLRYINSTSGAELPIPWPVVFWACGAEEGLKMATNPFDRVNLGYDGLFGPKTMFYHVPPAQGADLVETLNPPTLRPEWNEWVSSGTAVAVLAGFAWVCWQLWKGFMQEPAMRRGERKKTQ